MTRFDKVFLFVILAPILLILLFLAGWWISLLFIPENRVFIVALVGLIIGILLDVLFLKKWIKKAYRINKYLLLLIYIFYSIGFFGFFMGVPVFNLFLGIPVGVFIARQTKILKFSEEKIKKGIEKACLISVIFMLLICISSAAIALSDPYTAGSLEGMLRLPFEVTREMIIGLIIIGGVALLAFQYAITKFSAHLTLTKS